MAAHGHIAYSQALLLRIPTLSHSQQYIPLLPESSFSYIHVYNNTYKSTELVDSLLLPLLLLFVANFAEALECARRTLAA